jgi:hypothetical protein
MSRAGRPSYRLVREESRVAGKRYRISREIAAAVCLVAGVVLIALAIHMLTAEEGKLDRPVTEQSYSTSRIVVVSAAFLVTGPGIIALAAVLHGKARKNRRSLAGSPLLWQTPFLNNGELPFPDTMPVTSTGPGGTPGEPEGRGSLGAPQEEGVAFCPRCGGNVAIRDGICLVCGNPVV